MNKHVSIKRRFGRKAPYPQGRKLGVLAGGFESSRSSPASQTPRRYPFTARKRFPNTVRVGTVPKHRPSLWTLGQLPVRFLWLCPMPEDIFLFHVPDLDCSLPAPWVVHAPYGSCPFRFTPPYGFGPLK